ncbi:hypothetical protein [Niastella yeongjuensis]|nr:hypothetical protein [Niastella yeongjuensis]SEP08875.1 hypothetical protein SAMN05660816_04328 [Niastella yeongjuensis]
MQKKLLTALGLAMVLFAACKKDAEVNLTPDQPVLGSYINDGDTLNTNGRAIKGTLKADGTYYLYSNYGDAVINAGDTLLIQVG